MLQRGTSKINMKNMQGIKISLYLASFVLSNFIVLKFGNKGLIFTAFFLIPFDFTIRCMFHESWTGRELFFKLGLLIVAAALLTYFINSGAKNIAIGSCLGFLAAQIFAGAFYQAFIKKSFFVKVNGSDLIGIIADSAVFQTVAFHHVDLSVFFSQVALKVLGGAIWYYLFFVRCKQCIK